MRYTEFRDAIRGALRQNGAGLTWAELRERLALPYDRACPEWTKDLEREIGLVRVKGAGRALVWRLENTDATKQL
ncbi:MAG: hypothetical protein ACAI43_17605 [Phycisphaerae bacterium]|nr:hypothetical protein [Tepidisphaeraceae bacterium]